MNNCIVIFYDGSVPSEAALTALAMLVHDHMSDGASPVIHTLDSKELAKLIVKTVGSKKPTVSCEEGDHAVAIIDTFLGRELDRKNLDTMKLALWRLLVHADRDTTEASRNFIKAMSVLSQGNPVSSSARKTHGVTQTMIDAINSVYTEFNA